jgi:prolycopene isomerase
MEDAEGTIFVSIPTLLDPTLAPPGHHIIHTFTPSWCDDWQRLSPTAYKARKEAAADRLIQRLESIFPHLSAHLDYQEIGTPRTHRRFLGRDNGTYGPIPRRKLAVYWVCPSIAQPFLACTALVTAPFQDRG